MIGLDSLYRQGRNVRAWNSTDMDELSYLGILKGRIFAYSSDALVPGLKGVLEGSVIGGIAGLILGENPAITAAIGAGAATAVEEALVFVRSYRI